MLGGGYSIAITENIDDHQVLEPEFKTMFWSMEKMAWLQTKTFPKLPTNFTLISGCTVAVNRNLALLIGGHYVIKSNLGIHYFAQNYFPNDQVLQYNFQNQTWTWLENIPYEKVSKQNAKINSLFQIRTF